MGLNFTGKCDHKDAADYKDVADVLASCCCNSFNID